MPETRSDRKKPTPFRGPLIAARWTTRTVGCLVAMVFAASCVSHADNNLSGEPAEQAPESSLERTVRGEGVFDGETITYTAALETFESKNVLRLEIKRVLRLGSVRLWSIRNIWSIR